MQDDQIDVNHEQVAALIPDQLPDLAGRDVVAVDGAGTVHAIYWIGDDVGARFLLRHADPAAVLDQLRRESVSGIAEPAPSNLPARPTPLIGRAIEVARISELRTTSSPVATCSPPH